MVCTDVILRRAHALGKSPKGLRAEGSEIPVTLGAAILPAGQEI